MAKEQTAPESASPQGGDSRIAQMVLGFDLGASTGVAAYVDGVLKSMQTIKPEDMGEFLGRVQTGVARLQVVFEDSRLQSVVFSAKGKPGKPLSVQAQLKVARDVGRIDAWCTLLEAQCKQLGIQALGVSPQEKGSKLNAQAFERATCWSGRTNEHERDAAMVARPFRKGFKL